MDTRYCKRCDTDLPVDSFNKDSSRKTGLQVYCRSCMKDYKQRHYTEHKSETQTASRERSIQRRLKARIQIQEFKKDKPCMDCGIVYNPWVMEFDHRNPTLKEHTVSALSRSARSWSVIKAEIDKCDLVCANCHRERTAARAGWLTI